ncbi:helix-turn-helix domain-containing protein [Anoxybacillus sp. MB8]|uniref:helix-turn-helix domain-containing protein n=1 Tax=Anoxybacillus sp. MB8 TaxID=2496850 RepID=UPI0013D14FC4|nr:helix-turn-helix domain-containing protein [Anoxybacillus sp. MB8]
MNVLGNRLKKLRERHNLTQERAGEIFGLTKYQIHRYESGTSNPDPDIINKFADYYGVSADYLLGRTDDPNPPGSDNEELGTLARINQLIKEYGIEQMGFFDIEKWKQLSEEEIEEIVKHFEWVVHKAREKNKSSGKDTRE